MKRISKKEWVAVAAAAIFVAYVFFGGDIMKLFRGESMNKNSTAAVAVSGVNSGGVIIRDIIVGQGEEIKVGQKVSVNYVLSLSDGTIIQNSKELGAPFTFTLGAGEVIQGWEAGFAGMKVGGVRMIVVPPELGYGSAQVGPIPANSTLIFTVEALYVTDAAPQPVQ